MDDPGLVAGEHRRHMDARVWDGRVYASAEPWRQCSVLLFVAVATLVPGELVGGAVNWKIALLGGLGIILSVPFRLNLRFVALSVSCYLVAYSLFHSEANSWLLAFSFLPAVMLLYARDSTR